MRIMARLHSWLGWFLAIPLLFWTVSGLILADRPLDLTSGQELLKNAEARPLPPGWLAAQLIEGEDRPVEMRTRMQGNSVVTSAIYSDGKIERYFARSGEPVPEIDMAAARTIVAMEVTGGDAVQAVTFFDGTTPPDDFGRSAPVWQVVLEDGTHVYVGRESGAIEAVRTPSWRAAHDARAIHTLGGNGADLRLAAYGVLVLLVIVLLTALAMRRHRSPRVAGPAEPVES